MIAYPIEAAKASGLFDTIAVSTEDDAIATLVYDLGASLIVKRPPELADDYATTADVMKQAVSRIEAAMSVSLDVVCCLYAPTPFVEAEDLKRGLAALSEARYHYAFSVAEFESPIWRALSVDRDGIVRPVFPSKAEARSQDLIPTYRDAGQWYFGRAAAWKNAVPIYGAWSVGVKVGRVKAIDIDTPEDFAFAEQLWRGKA